MSDEEDDQNLLEEIRALESALGRRRSDENIEDPNANTSANLAEIEAAYYTEQDEDSDYNNSSESDRFESDDNAVSDGTLDDLTERYYCTNLQDLLELNKTLIESLTKTRDEMSGLLHDCQTKQIDIENQIKHAPSGGKKIICFNAGMPYFKDKQYFSPPNNKDVEDKIKRGELRLHRLPKIHKWRKQDKSSLLHAVKFEVSATILKRPETTGDLSNLPKIKASQLPDDIKQAIGPIGSVKFDWLKIANNIPENTHSAEECEVMWNVFLHPELNKTKWTPKEDKKLNKIVDEYRGEDWDSIAKQLGSNRSNYQCFVRYNTNNWKNLMKGQCWTIKDDAFLLNLVKRLKMGDYTPWGYLACCMNNYTKQQIYFRYTFSLAPHLKKGKYTVEEDNTLLEAVSKYGPNFSKISALALPHRTNIQLKEHYQTLIKKDNSKKIWTEEEDTLLYRLHKEHGFDWATIANEIPGTSRVQVRQRCVHLLRSESKGISVDKIHQDNFDNSELDTSSHTTFTFSANQPWARENHEIRMKHLKVDEQLIHFFKNERMQKKKVMDKASDPINLKQKTERLHDIFTKLFVKIDIPQCIDNAPMDENHFDLLLSLEKFIEERKTTIPQKIESIRFKMFGSQETVPKSNRFIPPLPFNFKQPKKRLNDSKSIDYVPHLNEYHQVELDEDFEQNLNVLSFLKEDEEYQFEKFNNYLCEEKDIKFASLRNVPFPQFSVYLKSNLIQGKTAVDKDLDLNAEYNWKLNKMIFPSKDQNEVVTDPVNYEGIPPKLIEPNRTTLQAYQELLISSESFPTETIENHGNYKLTSRGRDALRLLKTRFEQLFSIPTGLSRIIPPDIVDESAFLPILERFKKSNKKKKRLKAVSHVDISD